MATRTGFLGRTLRHMDRYRQVLTVLIRHGFGDILSRMRVHDSVEMKDVVVEDQHHVDGELTGAQRLRLALEQLGPTFMKMGQILSTRPDLVSPEVVAELAKLQDHAPSFPFSEAREIIEQELSGPLERFFAFVDEIPLAAASLGQVHAAKLLDGDNVVIKVQRPGVADVVTVDLEILRYLTGVGERYLETLKVQRPTQVVDELARTMYRELNYRQEAAHLAHFARNHANVHDVHVPRAYSQFITERVLVMERITGWRVDERDQLIAAGFEPDDLARRGANAVMRQIFDHGFFHADPHPGNLFILKGPKICFIDFGMVGRLNRQRREAISDFIWSVLRRDDARTVDAIARISGQDDIEDRDSLQREVADLIDQHLDRPLKEFDFGDLVNRTIRLSTRHRVTIPPDIFLMLKSLATMETVARNLSPDFDLSNQARPYLARLRTRRLSPRRILGDVFDTTRDFWHLLRTLPRETRLILRQVKSGKLSVQLEPTGLEQLGKIFDRVSNRLSFAIVLAALIIGSSLIVLAKVPPQWNNVPIIGIAGYMFAGVMGFWLLISILRNGQM